MKVKAADVVATCGLGHRGRSPSTNQNIVFVLLYLSLFLCLRTFFLRIPAFVHRYLELSTAYIGKNVLVAFVLKKKSFQSFSPIICDIVVYVFVLFKLHWCEVEYKSG